MYHYRGRSGYLGGILEGAEDIDLVRRLGPLIVIEGALRAGAGPWSPKVEPGGRRGVLDRLGRVVLVGRGTNNRDQCKQGYYRVNLVGLADLGDGRHEVAEVAGLEGELGCEGGWGG